MERTIILKADYRGVLTGERFYRRGRYVVGRDMPQDDADALIHHGRAEVVEAVGIHEPRKQRGKGGL